eukprot:SAG11_NODE_362_length_10182_cov_9.886641_5_plen_53_part_00
MSVAPIENDGSRSRSISLACAATSCARTRCSMINKTTNNDCNFVCNFHVVIF